MTIDPHTGSEEVRKAVDGTDLGALLRQPDGSYDSLPACVEYLQHYGVRDKVRLVVARFEEVFDFLHFGMFDLIFVDGDHSYERAYADGKAGIWLVQTGGKVVFHDHEQTWPDVMRAVADLGGGRQLAGALAELV